MMVPINDVQGDLSIYHQRHMYYHHHMQHYYVMFRHHHTHQHHSILQHSFTQHDHMYHCITRYIVFAILIIAISSSPHAALSLHVSSRYDIITSFIIIAVCLNDHHHISVFSNYHITAYMTLT